MSQREAFRAASFWGLPSREVSWVNGSINIKSRLALPSTFYRGIVIRQKLLLLRVCLAMGGFRWCFGHLFLDSGAFSSLFVAEDAVFAIESPVFYPNKNHRGRLIEELAFLIFYC